MITRAMLAMATAMATPVLATEIDVSALDRLPEAAVVFLGEVHDNAQHHVHQERALISIAPAAIVFEMLTDAQARSLSHPLPLRDDLQEQLDWDASGWPDFAMYYPLFTAVPDVQIFGAALPRAAARAAMAQPLAEAFVGDAALFGLDVALPRQEQEARESLQASAHCDALPTELLPAMVDIQRLRDAMLAEAALRAFNATGGPVAVITGTGHARRDWGAPAALALAAPELSQLSIGQFEAPPTEPPPFDLWLVTDPEPRPDPCDAFR
ncbi:MAG: hypothetical protein EA339_10890 [Rhodobacteraceae bacterium]|nr:MAG: hypothetical protein EA339_10890 [Paracoccaceae bacterium]